MTTTKYETKGLLFVVRCPLVPQGKPLRKAPAAPAKEEGQARYQGEAAGVGSAPGKAPLLKLTADGQRPPPPPPDAVSADLRAFIDGITSRFSATRELLDST